MQRKTEASGRGVYRADGPDIRAGREAQGGGTLVMWASPSRAMSAPDGILDVSDSRNSTADALLTWLSAAASAPSSSRRRLPPADRGGHNPERFRNRRRAAVYLSML